MGFETIKQIATVVSNWVEEQEEYGQAVYVLFLAIWIVATLPSSIGEAIPGYVFGFKRGFVVAYLGKNLGLLLSYIVAKYLLKGKLESMVLNKSTVAKAFKQAIKEEGFQALLMLRFSATPMLLKNYGLALLGVSMKDYILAGIISGFPTAVLWALVGAASHDLTDIVEGKQSIWTVLPENTFVIASIGLPLTGVFVYYMVSFGCRFQKIKKNIENNQAPASDKNASRGSIDENISKSSNMYKYGLLFLTIVFVGIVGNQLRSVNVKTVMNDTVVWIEKQGNWGPIYYTIFLGVWVTLLLPCSVLEVVPGFLFGFKTGWAISVVGKSVGSLVSLFLGRYFLASRVRGYVLTKYPTLKAFEKAVDQEGFKVILMIRVAYLPMLIKNYGLSILDIPIPKIVLASFIAGVPFSAAWAAIGASSKNLAEIMEGKAKLSDALPKDNRELLAVAAVVGIGSFMYVLGKFGARFREIMAQVKAEENKKIA